MTTQSSASSSRIQTNFVAKTERMALDWLCVRMPLWMKPDHLTSIGAFGAVMIFAGYALSVSRPGFLWLVIAGFVVHWFGDSLDGSLARSRKIERPRYGYFLDHSVDAICNLLIMVGLGLSAFVRMDVALFTLVGYFMLSMYVFLFKQVSGTFQLSFLAMGPTELRIALIIMALGMYFLGNVTVALGAQTFSIYDGLLLFAGSVFVVVFCVQVFFAARDLAIQEPGI